jgi:hypothetical protein
MTALTQAEVAKELGSWHAKGWAWAWQRCGRYEYRKCLVHSTNPDHLVPQEPSATNVPPPSDRHPGTPLGGLRASTLQGVGRQRSCRALSVQSDLIKPDMFSNRQFPARRSVLF